jgi:hypothetical protein
MQEILYAFDFSCDAVVEIIGTFQCNTEQYARDCLFKFCIRREARAPNPSEVLNPVA